MTCFGLRFVRLLLLQTWAIATCHDGYQALQMGQSTEICHICTSVNGCYSYTGITLLRWGHLLKGIIFAPTSTSSINCRLRCKSSRRHTKRGSLHCRS